MKSRAEMTREEMVDMIASDYAIDRSIVDSISRSQPGAPYESLETAVADELERIIAIESGELEW